MNKSKGIGFTGALTILFIGLKLTDVIHWSWLWVLSPVWLPLVLAVTLLGIAAGVKTVRSRTSR